MNCKLFWNQAVIIPQSQLHTTQPLDNSLNILDPNTNMFPIKPQHKKHTFPVRRSTFLTEDW